MKLLPTILGVGALLLSASSCFAAHAVCYSNATIMFDGQVKDIYYTEQFITFVNKATNKPMFVFGNCVITMDKSDFKGKKYHAAKQVKK